MQLKPYKTNDDILYLPQHIQDSLKDHKELSHIRKINDDYYLLLRYPDKVKKNLNPICILASNNETQLIYKETPSMSLNLLEKFSTLDIINYTIKQYTEALEKIDIEINEYEQRMDDLVQKDEIRNLFSLTRELITYQIAIEAIEDTVDYIINQKIPSLWKNDYEYEYVNIQIELRQISKNIQTSVQIIDSILNVSESLFANILSKTVRTLTAITIIISIPTLITGYYSMNINLPHNEAPNILIYIILASLIPTFFVFWIFKKKKYL